MFETIIECQQPVYTFSDELKKICPKKMSKYNAIAVFLIWSVIGTIIYFTTKKKNKDAIDDYDSLSDFHKEHRRRPKKFNKTGTIISISMCAILLSIFSFFFTRFGFKSSILKYENMFKYYESQGITGKAAVDRIELDVRSRRRDSAISRSGSRSYNGYSNNSSGISFNSSGMSFNL